MGAVGQASDLEGTRSARNSRGWRRYRYEEQREASPFPAQRLSASARIERKAYRHSGRVRKGESSGELDREEARRRDIMQEYARIEIAERAAEWEAYLDKEDEEELDEEESIQYFHRQRAKLVQEMRKQRLSGHERGGTKFFSSTLTEGLGNEMAGGLGSDEDDDVTRGPRTPKLVSDHDDSPEINRLLYNQTATPLAHLPASRSSLSSTQRTSRDEKELKIQECGESTGAKRSLAAAMSRESILKSGRNENEQMGDRTGHKKGGRGLLVDSLQTQARLLARSGSLKRVTFEDTQRVPSGTRPSSSPSSRSHSSMFYDPYERRLAARAAAKKKQGQ